MKNTTARMAVVRDRKFAEPVAPKRLPEAPEPNAAPTSAPLPCWSSTSPMIDIAARTCATMSRVSQISISSLSGSAFHRGGADREEVRRHERRAADEAAVDVGLREQLLRVR